MKQKFKVHDCQNKEDWLEFRQSRGMSSEAPAIMDCSAFKSTYDLNLLKRRKIEPEDIQDLELEWNRWREKEILEWYCYWDSFRAEPELRNAGLTGDYEVQIPDPEFGIPLAATCDGIGFDMDDNMVIVEIKTASEYSRKFWSEEVPDYVFWQVAHQLLVTGLKKALVIVSIGGRAPIGYWVEPTDQEMEVLYTAWEEFWEKVWNDEDDDPGWSTPVGLIAPEDSGPSEADIEFQMLYDEYLVAKDREKYAKKEAAAAKNILLRAMPSKTVRLPSGMVLEWQERSNGNYLIEKEDRSE